MFPSSLCWDRRCKNNHDMTVICDKLPLWNHIQSQIHHPLYKNRGLLWVCCRTQYDKQQSDCQRNILSTVGTEPVFPPVAFCVRLCLFLKTKRMTDWPYQTLPADKRIYTCCWWVNLADFPPNCTIRQPPLFSRVLSGAETKPTAFSLNRGIDMTRTFAQREQSSQNTGFMLISSGDRETWCLLGFSLSLCPCRFLYTFWHDGMKGSFFPHIWQKTLRCNQIISTTTNSIHEGWLWNVAESSKKVDWSRVAVADLAFLFVHVCFLPKIKMRYSQNLWEIFIRVHNF